MKRMLKALGLISLIAAVSLSMQYGIEQLSGNGV